MTSTTAYRTCPLCEAMCGLEIEVVDGTRPGTVRGDRGDIFSAGYICPKGASIGKLHEDPDRLRTPMVRDAEGWHEATWDEAFAVIERRLPPLLEEYGRDALAVYLGNPSVHDHSVSLALAPFLRALGTKYRFSASTLDQLPKQVASGLMFGSDATVAIPDIDHTDYFLVLGANPLVSNGSMFTAADLPGRLRKLRERGGRLVVVDPRRTRTADAADEHLAIRPGTDAFFLAALAHTLFDEGLVRLRDAGPHVAGLDDVRAAVTEFVPEKVADACGIEAATIRRIARELVAYPTAVVYGRIGTTTTEFGTTASWLVDVLNTITGNLDRRGGVMFTKPAAGSANTQGQPGVGRGTRIPGSKRTRVRGLPSALGEMPTAAMAEEMDTPSEDGTRIRALITVAGNPALSSPNAARLEKALMDLDFMVSLDIYLNETTRHADVILPAPSTLTRTHYDIAFTALACRNVVRFSPATLPGAEDERPQSETLLRLGAIAIGNGMTAEALDDMVAGELARRLVADPQSRVTGREPEELLAAAEPLRLEDRLLDMMLRAGPYGDGLGSHPDGLNLRMLEAAPARHRPRPAAAAAARSPAHAERSRRAGALQLLADVPRLVEALHQPSNGLRLVGRRDLRSNNSWMHNIEPMVKGRNRCTLQVNPVDADRLGLVHGALALVQSAAGAVEVETEVTDAIREGVVSIPHGWGHDRPDTRIGVATAHAGVNSNVLTDEMPMDPISGTSVLNGIPVTVVPA